MKCPNCGFENLLGLKFCGMCGLPLARACGACGFANPLTYRFCGMCGARLAEATDQPALPPAPAPTDRVLSPGLPLEGERRLATVILADVTRSTDLMEQIGSEAWVGIMNRVFQILETEIYRFGGEVDQFRGDGLVAFFGATSAHEDDPERAVLAALAMQTEIKRYAAELAQQRGIELLLRVGVNTGQVIVASIGDDRQHREDTAMGAAIALAARIEAAAEPGTVLVSENTLRLVAAQFDWQPLGEIPLKGIRQPVAVYRPLAPRTSAERLHRLKAYGISVPLIGRESEFQTLKNIIQAHCGGRGGIVLLTGDTGMGKSLLVTRVRQQIARDDALLAETGDDGQPPPPCPPQELTWLQGRCRSYDQSWPYAMWLDLLRGWLGVRKGEDKETTHDRLYAEAEALWGDQATRHYPYLTRFLSLPIREPFLERVKHLDAEGLRQQLFLTLRSWVAALAQQKPLTLVFDDVHWADATSLELLEYCLPLCDHLPLLWLIMFRPDRTSVAWDLRHRVETEYPHRVTKLVLSPLTEAQSSEMIDRIVGPDVLPQETRALVLDRAEGNPYYVEEFVHSLIRDGALEQDPDTGQWHATRAVTSLDLPDTLQNLLLARIAGLSFQERRVLQMAAVIGSVFWSDVLEELIGDTLTLKHHLTALQRTQLIHEHGRVPDLGIEYAFGSTLTRDVAYEGLLSTQRIVYHRQVAESLERLLGQDTLVQHAGLLAYQYHCAGEKGKELFYSLLAAGRAQEIYANAEALEHYERALALLDEMEAQTDDENRLYAIRSQRFEVLNQRRPLHFLVGDFEAGWADAQALLPLAHQLADDPTWMIDALLQQPGVGYFRSKDQTPIGLPLAEQALELARQLGDRRREMQSLGAIAGQRYMLNDPSWQEIGEQALQLAQQLGDKRYEFSLLLGVGQAYAVSEPERSMEYLDTALPICRALDDQMAELELLSAIGIQLESSGDYYRRLEECHQEQLRIAREIGHRPAEARALMFYGQIQSLYLGDYEGGLALLQECQRMWEDIPNELFPLLRIAQVQVLQGQYDAAQATLERARRIAEGQTHDMGRAGLNLVSAMLYNALGHRPSSALEARDCLSRVLELCAQTRQLTIDNPQLSEQYQMVAECEATAAQLGLAHILDAATERRQHLESALASSQAALDIYEASGFVRPIECVSEEILYRHSLALDANGHAAQAATYLERAHDEMMHKHTLIPPESPFRRTFLENIALHREIRTAMSALQGSKPTRPAHTLAGAQESQT